MRKYSSAVLASLVMVFSSMTLVVQDTPQEKPKKEEFDKKIQELQKQIDKFNDTKFEPAPKDEKILVTIHTQIIECKDKKVAELCEIFDGAILDNKTGEAFRKFMEKYKDDFSFVAASKLTVFNQQMSFISLLTNQKFIKDLKDVEKDGKVEKEPVLGDLPSGLVFKFNPKTEDGKNVKLDAEIKTSIIREIKDCDTDQGMIQVPDVVFSKAKFSATVPTKGSVFKKISSFKKGDDYCFAIITTDVLKLDEEEKKD